MRYALTRNRAARDNRRFSTLNRNGLSVRNCPNQERSCLVCHANLDPLSQTLVPWRTLPRSGETNGRPRDARNPAGTTNEMRRGSKPGVLCPSGRKSLRSLPVPKGRACRCAKRRSRHDAKREQATPSLYRIISAHESRRKSCCRRRGLSYRWQ